MHHDTDARAVLYGITPDFCNVRRDSRLVTQEDSPPHVLINKACALFCGASASRSFVLLRLPKCAVAQDDILRRNAYLNSLRRRNSDEDESIQF